ncbi:hypothetical protein F4859DRAFT_462456 [Xylaria cf. heliscus]|nr:hypothetical protein F4859DRAFT_462456 [Xylaria cf. heliscus]
MDAVGSQRIRRVNKCSLCSRFPRLSSTWKQCNWFVRGGVQYGCELCWQWGMVCVVGNVALPPYPDPTLQHHRFHNKCRPCKDHKLTCDRQRPCDGCVLHLGNPNGCAEPDRLRGTFRRGDGYATDMYTYLSMLGGGPDGMQSRQKYLEILDMPGDFHVQYASWLAGGALPVPPGYPPPARSPTRPPLRLRTLPDRIPIQQRKPNIALDARGPPRLTASSPFPSRVVTLYAENRDLLGPLVRRRNWLELSDISEAFRGPPSPPPNFTFFNVAQIPDLEERINLPFGVPGRISQCRAHPNEANIPALRAVPSSVQPRTLLISQQCAEQQTREAGSVCTRSARSACVDISHSQNVPVCIHCDEAARRVVVQAIISIAKSIRAYACSECAAAAGPNEFQGRALNVWGLAPNAFDNGGPPNPANSVSRGAPRPVTGCMCATKLANNTLCTPHRLSHFQTVRSTADALRNFVLANFGVMICPFCLLRPGADALDYADHQNNPHQRVAYVCMACLGIVTTDAATHESLDAIGAI